ncbi:sensor histidine kinase [Acetivibrio clariflavus]|uniref:sensor histidine kinase n=1 Tax=Acetivibrio clariflavus TaxID=288965 RepID=UPI000486AF8D|nr:GHKL domain-containing protein [Acetivibrio clariflavus]
MLAVKFISLSLIGIIQETIIGIILLLIFNLEFNWKKVFSYALVMGLSGSFSATFLRQAGPTAYIFIFVFTALFILLFFYKFSLLKSIMAMCILYLLKAIVSTLCLPIYKLFYRTDFNAVNMTLIEHLISQGLGTVLFIIIALIIYLFKYKIDMPDDFSKKSTVTVVINVIISILLLYPNIIHLHNYMHNETSPLLIYNSISLVFIVLINTINFIKFGKIEILKQNVEFQNLYIQTLNEMIDSLRGFKHDYNNMLQVMQGYISVNDMEGLKNFHSQLLAESRKINNFVPLNSYIKDVPPVYGLLLSKISYSEIKNVTINITVTCKLKITNIKIYDFCKILGILLDNAIEAAAESEKKLVELSIRESPDKSSLFIEITNSCIGTVDISSIFKDGYTTKKDHTGFGLWEVQKILSKYKNCKLYTNVWENYFSQKIEIAYNLTNE